MLLEKQISVLISGTVNGGGGLKVDVIKGGPLMVLVFDALCDFMQHLPNANRDMHAAFDNQIAKRVAS